MEGESLRKVIQSVFGVGEMSQVVITFANVVDKSPYMVSQYVQRAKLTAQYKFAIRSVPRLRQANHCIGCLIVSDFTTFVH